MIVWIDMHIRDERVLEFIKVKSSSDWVKISATTIAERFRCHPNTARSILKRLVLAGRLDVKKSSYAGGFYYRVTNV